MDVSAVNQIVNSFLNGTANRDLTKSIASLVSFSEFLKNMDEIRSISMTYETRPQEVSI